MVKKVIDIIPPEKIAAGEQEAEVSPIQTFQDVPLAQAAEELSSEIPTLEDMPEAKPKLTYIVDHKSKIIFAPGKKPWLDNFFKGLAWKLALVVVVAFAIMYAVDLRTAKAVVKIWPATSSLRDEVKITVDPGVKDVDPAKNTVPGLMMMFDDTIKGESTVTTMKDTKGKAQGTVKIFNNFSTAQRLVKGTRLQAPLEKFQPALTKDETPWFRTAEDVVIDPKSSATVKVVADGSGEKYNIDPSVFSVPGLVGTAQYTFVYAQSFEKFAGGSAGNAPEVAQADLDNAKTAIIKQANNDIKDQLLKEVPDGYVLLEDTIKTVLDAPVISAKIGDPLAKIPCQVHGKSAAAAYRKSDIDNLGKNFILNEVPTGSLASEKTLEIKSAYSGIDATSGKPSLTLDTSVLVYAGMDESDLKKGLSEKSAKEAQIFLMNQPGMKDAKIQLTPAWRFNIPRDLDRIEVQTILD